MGILLKPEHLKRYRDITWLLVKYGRSDLVKTAGLEDILKDETTALQKASSEAQELATDLENLGPTFVKLGQLLSTRADLLPAPYLGALARLQDKIEPFPFEEVERIVSSELGMRLSKGFEQFDPTPIAAASLGQVHRATLRSGLRVVVKVQRPDIRQQIVEDLDALDEVAAFLDDHTEMGRRYEFRNMLEGLRQSLLQELDYRQEANNLVAFAENLKDFDRIVVPQPVDDYTTSRVLTMDFIRGRKVTSLGPLARTEIDGAALAEQLFRAYLQQMLVDGFFHADPHPGNVFLTDDGRIALLDLGMVARLTPRMQELFLKLLLAISEGRGEDAAQDAIALGEAKDDFNQAEFSRRIAELVAQQQHASLDRIDAGRVALAITQISGECGFRTPPAFTMVAKTLLNLDRVVWTLDPDFDPNASIRRNAMDIIRQRMFKSIKPGNIFGNLIEVKDLIERLPRRVNQILDAAANNEFKVNIDAIDEKVLIDGFQKVANRIAVGLILAALIVGAAMLMRVETPFKILGYPGFAIILFLAAAGGGIALVVNIILSDTKVKK